MTQELLYYGPPGTGKTQNISNLIRDAIEEGIPPERIACVSFTRKAASESREESARTGALQRTCFPISRLCTRWPSTRAAINRLTLSQKKI